MRIHSIEAIPVSYPEPNDFNALRHLCLCKITADDGQVGWGESITQFPEASSATKFVIEGMAEQLVMGGCERIQHQRLAGRVDAERVTERCHDKWLIQRDPQRDAVGETCCRERGIVSEPIRGITRHPAAGVL